MLGGQGDSEYAAKMSAKIHCDLGGLSQLDYPQSRRPRTVQIQALARIQASQLGERDWGILGTRL